MNISTPERVAQFINKSAPNKRRFGIQEDVLVRSDPNYEIKDANSLLVYNMGSTLVKVNQWIMIPDSKIEVPPPNTEGGTFDWKLSVLFGVNFIIDLDLYPYLVLGPKLLIVYSQEKYLTDATRNF